MEHDAATQGVAGNEALDDLEIVSRVVAGEVPLFELLVRRHNPRLFRVLRGILHQDAEAEDALQQAWLQAFAHLPSFDGRSQLLTWLTRIAVNEGMHRRGHGLRVVAAQEQLMREPSPEKDPEAQAAAHQLARVLERAVDRLPELYRPVFVLREVEGLATRECAEVLGVTEDVVKVRLHRARALLREDIDAQVGAAAREAFSFAGAACDRVTRAVMARLLGPM